MFRNSTKIRPSEITSEHIYLHTRRQVLHTAGALALGSLPTARAQAQGLPPSLLAANFAMLDAAPNPNYQSSLPHSSWHETASYVLYHEFGESADEAIQKSASIKTEPWTVSVEGEVRRPKTYALQELLRLAPLEERVYRY
jgi:methionine sulfoxide reductase catalytic subunit